ncbi:MAG: SOS response-associated peptidase [Robinsoniella sp.]|nr:SOS response-associated peptidase [Robinsoniella sp.]
MCTRYYVDETVLDQIQQTLNGIDNRLTSPKYAGDMLPTNYAPVIECVDGRLCLTEKKWGYPGIKPGSVVLNARAESVHEKRIFQDGIQHHRIVIPARHFYEWNKNKEKFTFHRQDFDLLFFAGFSDMIENEPRFVILTTQANDSMVKVHDRMPLILEKEQIDDWLKKDDSVMPILHQTLALLNRWAEYEQQTLDLF